MRTIFLTIFFGFSFSILFAQIPDWEWAHSAESNYGIRSNTISTDTNGNIYTTGFGGGGLPIKFDSITINTPYFFISKYSSSGNIQWAKGTVGGTNAQGIGMVIDLYGNIIVCGKSAPDNITFGGITLNATGNFLVKYRSNGSVIWAKNIAGSGNDSASVMHLTNDKLGNIYIIGYFNCHNLYIGNTLLNNAQLGGSGSDDCFIAKYDSLGNPLWAASSGGDNNEVGNSIAVDTSGNVYITGFFTSSIMYFNGTNIINNGNHDIFIAKYNSSGIIQWGKGFGGAGLEIGGSVIVDARNNIYHTGVFSSTNFNMGNFSIINHTLQNASYMAKLDSSGNVRWAKNISLSGAIGTRYNNIISDNVKNLYIGGSFSDTVIIGNTTLIGKSGVFVANFDSSGNSLWVQKAQSRNQQGGLVSGIIMDKKNNIYISGYYYCDTLIFRNAPLINSNPPGFGIEYMFVAKLSDAIVKVYEIEKENSICIFPNPANTSIAIKLNNNLQEVSSLRIMNMNGEIVAQHTLLKNNYDAQQIDISQLPNGIYVYSLFSNNKQLGKPGKLVVLH